MNLKALTKVIIGTPKYLWLLCALLVPSVHGATIDEIRQAWESRESRVESARVTWTLAMTVLKDVSGTDMPQRDISIKADDLSLTIQSGLIRRDAIIPLVYDPPPGVAQYSRISDAFDGTRHWHYHAPNRLPYGEGDLYPPHAGFRPMGVFSIWPVLLSYRPLDERYLGLDLDRFEKPTRSKLNIMGTPIDCVCLRGAWSGSRAECSFALDPARDYVVVRVDTWFRSSTALRARLDVAYEEHVVAGWSPSEWKVSIMNRSGALTKASRATVTSTEFNKSFPASLFQAHFPPETLVRDRVAGTKGYVQANGEIVYPTSDSEWKEVIDGDRRDWGHIVWLVLILLTLSAAAVVYWRWSRRHTVRSAS